MAYSFSTEDQLAFCNTCYRAMDNIERDLLTKTPERIASMYETLADDENVQYVFSEQQVVDSILDCCDWNEGDSMLFNSTRGRKTCRDFVYEFDDVMIHFLRKNEIHSIMNFCINWIDDQLCKSIFFTEETIKKIMKLHAEAKVVNHVDL